MASHNIFFVLLIIQEFESLWVVVKNAYLTFFYFSMCFARSVNVRKRDRLRQEKPTNIHVTLYQGIVYHSHSLREKCPNTEVFLGRIFPHLDWIRRNTSYLSVFSPNAGKDGPEKAPYLDTFHAVIEFTNFMKTLEKFYIKPKELYGVHRHFLWL